MNMHNARDVKHVGCAFYGVFQVPVPGGMWHVGFVWRVARGSCHLAGAVCCVHIININMNVCNIKCVLAYRMPGF